MLKRVLAIIGIVILAALYIMTLVFALSANENWQQLFAASAMATVTVPILLWIIIWGAKKLEANKKDSEEK